MTKLKLNKDSSNEGVVSKDAKLNAEVNAADIYPILYSNEYCIRRGLKRIVSNVVTICICDSTFKTSGMCRRNGSEVVRRLKMCKTATKGKLILICKCLIDLLRL